MRSLKEVFPVRSKNQSLDNTSLSETRYKGWGYRNVPFTSAHLNKEWPGAMEALMPKIERLTARWGPRSGGRDWMPSEFRRDNAVEGGAFFWYATLDAMGKPWEVLGRWDGRNWKVSRKKYRR